MDADIEHAKQYPDDKPYFGDGFPFQPYEESCGGDSSRYHVGSATVRSRIATVPVTVTWPRCRKLKPIVYKVKLVRWRSGWKIDDLIYDNGNTLKANLKYVFAGKEGT